MGPEEIETLLEHEPFVPFRITCNSGDMVVIDDPSVVTIIGQSLGIFDRDDRGHVRLRFVSITIFLWCNHWILAMGSRKGVQDEQ